jgi:repressor of nif and glnA expression
VITEASPRGFGGARPRQARVQEERHAGEDGDEEHEAHQRGLERAQRSARRHLYALGDVGLVRHARRGREQVWDLNPKRLEKAKRYLDQISSQWEDAAERLRAFVED